MSVNDYLKHFAQDYSKRIKKYAHEKIFKHYMFVSKVGKERIGYCTYCGQESWVPVLNHNEIYNCPNCRNDCIARQAGRGRKYMQDEAYFIYYEKSLIDKDVIVARGIYAFKDYSWDYKNVETHFGTRAYYIYKIGDPIMLKAYCYYDGNEMYRRRPEIVNYFNSLINQFPAKKPKTQVGWNFESLQNSVIETPFKYSCYDKLLWKEFGLIKYFALYSRCPFAVESLIKLGFEEFIWDKVYDRGTYGSINWKGNAIQKLFKLNKDDIKLLRESKDISLLTIKLYQISKKDGSNLSVNEIKKMEQEIHLKHLYTALKYTSLRKAFKYLKSQIKAIKPTWSGDVLTDWKDYIKDCIELGKDLKKESALFPKDLRKAHLATTKMLKVKANKILNEKIAQRSRALNVFSFEYNGLLIRPAATHAELIKEGDALGHCVASRYSETYANGKTNIFFIRKTSEPNKPFYTVEIAKRYNSKSLEIIQCRSKGNKTAEENKHDYVNEFLEVFKAEKIEKKPTKIKITA